MEADKSLWLTKISKYSFLFGISTKVIWSRKTAYDKVLWLTVWSLSSGLQVELGIYIYWHTGRLLWHHYPPPSLVAS